MYVMVFLAKNPNLRSRDIAEQGNKAMSRSENGKQSFLRLHNHGSMTPGKQLLNKLAVSDKQNPGLYKVRPLPPNSVFSSTHAFAVTSIVYSLRGGPACCTSMNQPNLPSTSAKPKLSPATIDFLDKHKAHQRAIDASLRAEIKALYDELSRHIRPGPPIGVDIDLEKISSVGNAEAAKRIDKIMRNFDVQVGMAQEREEVEKEVKKGLEEFRRGKSIMKGLMDTIARYEARDG